MTEEMSKIPLNDIDEIDSILEEIYENIAEEKIYRHEYGVGVKERKLSIEREKLYCELVKDLFKRQEELESLKNTSSNSLKN